MLKRETIRFHSQYIRSFSDFLLEIDFTVVDHNEMDFRARTTCRQLV